MAAAPGGSPIAREEAMRSGPVVQQKAALRAQMRSAASDPLHTAQRDEASGKLCAELQRQSPWREARRILLYVPRADEPDIWPLVVEALEQKREVFLPRYAGDDSYAACQVCDPATQLVPGRYGIPEPSDSCTVVDLMHLDFTVVPGIAFSFNGARLGRGRGYYDRLLPQVSGVTCGAAFDWQMVADVPMEPHDTRLQYIVTPTRWHRVVGSPRF